MTPDATSPALPIPWLRRLLVLVMLGFLWLAGLMAEDLYAGLVDGTFYRVRGQPISAADGGRHTLTAVGEAFTLLVLLLSEGVLVAIYRRLGREKKPGDTPPE